MKNRLWQTASLNASKSLFGLPPSKFYFLAYTNRPFPDGTPLHERYCSLWTSVRPLRFARHLSVRVGLRTYFVGAAWINIAFSHLRISCNTICSTEVRGKPSSVPRSAMEVPIIPHGILRKVYSAIPHKNVSNLCQVPYLLYLAYVLQPASPPGVVEPVKERSPV